MVDTVRVLVVDDQAPFRLAARMVLKRAEGFELVGEAATGEESVERVAELSPDLVLMDINMPGINGIEATRRIVAAAPDTVVFLCSTYQLGDLPADARTSGARAYVNKEELGPDVLARLWAEPATTARASPASAAHSARRASTVRSRRAWRAGAERGEDRGGEGAEHDGGHEHRDDGGGDHADRAGRGDPGPAPDDQPDGERRPTMPSSGEADRLHDNRRTDLPWPKPSAFRTPELAPAPAPGRVDRVQQRDHRHDREEGDEHREERLGLAERVDVGGHRRLVEGLGERPAQLASGRRPGRRRRGSAPRSSARRPGLPVTCLPVAQIHDARRCADRRPVRTAPGPSDRPTMRSVCGGMSANDTSPGHRTSFPSASSDAAVSAISPRPRRAAVPRTQGHPTAVASLEADHGELLAVDVKDLVARTRRRARCRRVRRPRLRRAAAVVSGAAEVPDLDVPRPAPELGRRDEAAEAARRRSPRPTRRATLAVIATSADAGGSTRSAPRRPAPCARRPPSTAAHPPRDALDHPPAAADRGSRSGHDRRPVRRAARAATYTRGAQRGPPRTTPAATSSGRSSRSTGPGSARPEMPKASTRRTRRARHDRAR